ncbi:MAG: TIGR03087 family PEP-CTERM/XrtA system glycosyltransferase [Methylococcaceae bacterium]
MEDLLFIVHRIPYPPNKGDKIRSFHFLKALTKHFRIYLGSFVDDREDWQYANELKKLCEEVFLLDLNPLQAKISSIEGFFTGQALSLPYYKNKQFQSWIDNTVRQKKIKKALIFSSVMAQFIRSEHNLELVSDFVDVDSDKWAQYAQKKKWLARFVYQRESKKLLKFERNVAKISKSITFVSENEAELFKNLAPESISKITFVNNGVDLDYFLPASKYEFPYIHDEFVITFTGAMDYWANCEAVIWLANDIFPKILNANPLSRFYIVGSQPTKAVLALSEKEGIIVTGRVDDIRPYIAHANLIVAPLRIARGIQNKVLEAMAMEKPVVVTPAAIEGIPISGQEDVIVAEQPDEFAKNVIKFMSGSNSPKISKANRAFIIDKFGWEACTDKLLTLIG